MRKLLDFAAEFFGRQFRPWLAAAFVAVAAFPSAGRADEPADRIDPGAAVVAAFSRTAAATPAGVTDDANPPDPNPTLSTVTPAARVAAKSAVCRVDTHPGGNVAYNGTGTCVWCEDGYSVILTAYHVIEHPGSVTVTHDGKRFAANRMDNVPGNDLALLWVAGEIPAARVAADKPAVGAKVTHYGLSSGGGSGVVFQYIASPTGHVMTASYKSESGDSGAGVFADDELVGVHCGRWGSADAAAPRKVVPVPYVNELCATGNGGQRFPLMRKLFGRRTQPAAAFPAPDNVDPAAGSFRGFAAGGTAGGRCSPACTCGPATQFPAGVPIGPGGTTSGGPTPPQWYGPAAGGVIVTGGNCANGVCTAPAAGRAKIGRGRGE